MSGPPPPSPADVVRPGDRFTEHYHDVAPTLYTWASIRLPAFLRQQLDAEDLVQEICCRAFLRFHTFDGARATFRNWIFGIANNVLREFLASAGRRRVARALPDTWSQNPDQVLPDGTTSVSRRVARNEALKLFVSRLEALDDEEKRLLTYRGLEGLAHQDVAKLLGTSVAAVEKRWQRLLARIQEWQPPSDLFER